VPYSRQQLRALATQGLGASLPEPPKKRKNEEFVLQCALVRWWADYCKTVGIPEFLLWHTPNSAVYGGSKENREKMGAMLKRMGQRSGVPDLFLSVAKKKTDSSAWWLGWHGLFIEMKAPDGVLSPAQKIMLPELEKQGYHTAVCWTMEDAQRVIQDYLR
jgi:hypothetical protein